MILAGEALEIVGIAKKIMMGRVGRSAYWLDHDPTGRVEAGYGPARSNSVTAHQANHVTRFDSGDKYGNA